MPKELRELLDQINAKKTEVKNGSSIKILSGIY